MSRILPDKIFHRIELEGMPFDELWRISAFWNVDYLSIGARKSIDLILKEQEKAFSQKPETHL